MVRGDGGGGGGGVNDSGNAWAGPRGCPSRVPGAVRPVSPRESLLWLSPGKLQTGMRLPVFIRGCLGEKRGFLEGECKYVI